MGEVVVGEVVVGEVVMGEVVMGEVVVGEVVVGEVVVGEVVLRSGLTVGLGKARENFYCHVTEEFEMSKSIGTH